MSQGNFLLQEESDSPVQEPAPIVNISKGRASPILPKDKDIDEDLEHSQRKTTFGFGLKTSTVVSKHCMK